MRSVPISHSITGPLARSIGPGFTGAERGKALTNAGGPSGPPFGVHYRCRWDNGAFSSHFYVARTPSVPLMGQTLSLVELRSPRDLAIFRKIYDHSIRIGDNAPDWEISYVQEFNITSDSNLFSPLEQWKAKGYLANAFGEWAGNDKRQALPLYEGRMVGQFDPCQKGWVKGKGRTAVWREIPADEKCIEAQFLIDALDYRRVRDDADTLKLIFMRISSATNTRSMIATILRGLPCEANASRCSLSHQGLGHYLILESVFNSFVFDFALRVRFSSATLNWFIVEEAPIPSCLPQGYDKTVSKSLIAIAASMLTFIHRRFAPEWLKLKHLYSELASKEWKHWWAVTEADRLRLRVEIDALCADLYGLDPDDLEWIVRDDPTDPKGFYRVDRHLPFRERLTGLAAAAFRALKEGRWSADSAASLSNDEFFDLLGIPELTNAQAAHTKSLPGQLIAKRDGCHVWKPENFPEDDPRHGWTWDDCWNDAVALLGSEEAVRKYLEDKALPTVDSTGEDRSSRRSSSAAQPWLFD